MSRRIASALLCALGALVGLSSCGTQSRIETTWQIPGYEGKAFSKLGVIAVMKNANDSKIFEAVAAEKFSAAGVQTVPGFTFLPSDSVCSKDQMEKCVSGTGADGVLMFKLIAVDKTKAYVPPTHFATAGAPYANWWNDPVYGYYAPYPYHYWGYWAPAVQVVRTPGYWQTSSNYQVETALYRAADGKLIWTAMSGTYNPTSGFDLGSSLSTAVIKKLQKAGLVGGAPAK